MSEVKQLATGLKGLEWLRPPKLFKLLARIPFQDKPSHHIEIAGMNLTGQ